jgi:hypothetical protein
MSTPMKKSSSGTARPRRGIWTAAVLALVLVAGVALFLTLTSTTSPKPAAATAAPRTLPAPTVTARPLASDPSLSTATPVQVPSSVLVGAPGQPKSLTPVALGKPSSFGNGVTSSLVSVKRVAVTAHRPGEISGAGLAVTVQLTNAGTAPVSLDTTSVNAFTGAAGAPATPVHGAATLPLKGDLTPGRSQSATYVFAVPTAGFGNVTVTVAWLAGSGTAVFNGAVA